MNTEQIKNVVCPTCRGLGKVPSNGDESRKIIHVRDQETANTTTDGKNLKLLTDMDTVVGYITDLLPEKALLDDPKQVIKTIQIRMRHSNSEDHKRAISDAVQVARNHPDSLKPLINLINKKIVDFLNSQRILYVRLACQSAGEIFRTMRCTERPMFDNIVLGLMNRTADKNQNVRIDANWALDKMVISVPASFSIKALANSNHHKNPAVKIAQLRLMHCVSVIADPTKILTKVELRDVRRLILKNCVSAVEDANAEIRCMSKKILELLKNTCYESFCSALVQDINWDELKIAEKNLNVEDLAVILKKSVK